MSDSKLYYGTRWSERYCSGVRKIRPRISMWGNIYTLRTIDSISIYSRTAAYLIWVKNTYLVYKQYGCRVFYMAVGDNCFGDEMVFDPVLTNTRTGSPVQFRKLQKPEWMFML